MIILIAFILLGAALAAVLVRIGWTGRAIDGHPVCRACGFDLFKLPADQAVCPECGVDLTTPRAVRTGNRERRRRPFYAGLALLLAMTLVAGLVAVGVARKVDFYRYAPDAWVERDTRSLRLSRQQAAWAELNRRFAENGLSRTLRLVDAALALQADRKAAWVAQAGDFIEAVHKADALPQDKWLRYADQATHLWLSARPRVGRGDPIVLEVIEDGNRVANNSVLLVRLADAHARGELVAEREKPQEFPRQGNEQIGTGSFREQLKVDTDRAAMEEAKPGKQTVDVVAHLEVLEGSEMEFDHAKPLLRQRHELKADFDLLDRQATGIEVIPDDSPELRKQVEATVKVNSAEVLPRSRTILLRTSFAAPPVPTAFRVAVRQGTNEWETTIVHQAASTAPAGCWSRARASTATGST